MEVEESARRIAMAQKTLTIEVNINEVERMTQAQAQLTGAGMTPMTGDGTAHCNPSDENIADIGDELATARALSDLAHQLLHAAVEDIEAHTHRKVERLTV
jgi:hypothetical protein